jgi:hypothetical protein
MSSCNACRADVAPYRVLRVYILEFIQRGTMLHGVVGIRKADEDYCIASALDPMTSITQIVIRVQPWSAPALEWWGEGQRARPDIGVRFHSFLLRHQ